MSETGTSATFKVDVRKWVDQAEANALAALQATATDALARIKELTPVRTGYLRANWMIIRAGDPLPIEGDVDHSAEVIASLQLGDQVILLNPVKYAMRVNFGFVGTDSLGRHYNQPGAHMLEQTIAEMPAIAAAATERVITGNQ